MMFGLSKKKKTTMDDEIKGFFVYKEVIKLIEKAKNLLKLGRKEEAVEVFSEAEQLALNAVKKAPNSVQANWLLAIFYQEAGLPNREEEIIDSLLNSGRFEIQKDNRIILEAELYKIRKEQAIADKSKEISHEDYAKIYSCQNCGRIIEFATMPCPHCQWYPSSPLSLARSIALSNPRLKVPALLLLAREVAKGRSPSEIVVNLDGITREYYEMPEKDSKLKSLFNLLQQNANKDVRDINAVRECPNCGHTILLSHEDECESCGVPFAWPESIKLLVCMDNLMWLFEKRVEVSNSREFSEFVILLTVMSTELLRKQESPSMSQRNYALSLMRDMRSISDANRGVVINTRHPDKLKIYLAKENRLEDSEQFGKFLYSELEFFVRKMIDGINL